MATVTTIAVGSSANDGTGDPIRTAFQTANTNFANINANLGYALYAGSSKIGPADATTYYWGSIPDLAATSTADIRRLYIPFAGVIKKCYIYTYTNGTNSSEAVSTYIRLNNTTDTLVSSSHIFTNDSEVVSKTDLSITVAAGDYIELKTVVGTLTTNPTNVYLAAWIWIQT